MRDDFAALTECQVIWDTLERRTVDRVAERSAAHESITREPVSFCLDYCDLIQWEQRVPYLPNRNGGDLYVYPGFILYRASRQAFALIDSREVALSFKMQRFIEDKSIPSDTQVVGQAWAKSNKDGTPDRRFRDNHQIPIVLYGSLIFTSPGGLHEEYECSDPALAERFARAWQAFGASLQGSEQAADAGPLPTRARPAKKLRRDKGAHAQSLDNPQEVLAMLQLGMDYYKGEGVAKDYAMAARLLRPVAGLDDAAVGRLFPASQEGLAIPPGAQNILGLIYLAGGNGVARDEAEAAKWLRLLAERGDADAQRNLGVLYHNGSGVPQDHEAAAKWFRASAEQGNRDTQAMLGEMYYLGHGLPQDYQEAVKWFLAAAEQGHVQAQTKLGCMLAAGGSLENPTPQQGVPKDYVSAYVWLELASMSGDERAKAERDALEKKVGTDELSEARRRVEERLHHRQA